MSTIAYFAGMIGSFLAGMATAYATVRVQDRLRGRHGLSEYLDGYRRGWHLRGIAECADRPRMRHVVVVEVTPRDDGQRYLDEIAEGLEMARQAERGTERS